MNGGRLVAEVLRAQGVDYLFTLCGGHISPILVECDRVGVQVIDTRDEKSAVFAADAVARMTGVPGVAAVTAGPGLTNTLTAVQNAYLAESPLVLIGGATATALKGRGALQDIDQVLPIASMVKSTRRVGRARDIVSALEDAFETALEGVPGPVFVELPVDLLYDPATVREWYGEMTGGGRGRSLPMRALDVAAKAHLFRIFRGIDQVEVGPARRPGPPAPTQGDVEQVAAMLQKAERPLIVAGSQTVVDAAGVERTAEALRHLGVPVYLGGSARGLLGREGAGIQFRHKRSAALKEADLVIVCGFPFDFRLGYGMGIPRSTPVVTVNRDEAALRKNRRPTLGVHADAGRLLQQLARAVPSQRSRVTGWIATLNSREAARDAEIVQQAAEPTEHINPLYLCREIERAMSDDAVMVVDGGDFVATASYICKPRGPLRWLDPGVFGTLGVGGGFAGGAALVRPGTETWLLWGDGSSAYSLAEFDTFARHGLPIIAVIGADGSWAQIARDQVELLGSDCGTKLRRADYHKVAEGYGGVGLEVDDPADVPGVLAEAKAAAARGRAVCVNAWIGATDFRKGSLSI